MELALLFRILRGLWVLAIALAVVVALYFAVPLLYPFIIGWLIAYMLQPLIRLLERKARFPRWLAVSASLVVFMGILSGIVTLLITRIVVEIQRLAQYINNNYENWLNKIDLFFHSDMLQRWTERISRIYAESGYQSTFDEGINSVGQKIAEAVTNVLQGLAQALIAIVAALPNIAFGLIVALLAAFFISKDWERVRAWSSARMPWRLRESAGTVWRDLQKALFGFLRAQLILISITTAFVIVGLLLLRVQYAVSIGLLIGLVDLMPYLGTGAVFVPWIIYVLLDGQYTFGLGLVILYALILIARQVAEPKVISSSLGLNPLVTLIGLFVGLKLFGFVGLILGPVLLVILMSIHRSGILNNTRKFIMHGKYWD